MGPRVRAARWGAEGAAGKATMWSGKDNGVRFQMHDGLYVILAPDTGCLMPLPYRHHPHHISQHATLSLHTTNDTRHIQHTHTHTHTTTQKRTVEALDTVQPVATVLPTERVYHIPSVRPWPALHRG